MYVQNINNKTNTSFKANLGDLRTLTQKLATEGTNYRADGLTKVADELEAIGRQLKPGHSFSLSTGKITPEIPEPSQALRTSLTIINAHLSRRSGTGDLADFVKSAFLRHGKILRRGYSLESLPDPHLIALA